MGYSLHTPCRTKKDRDQMVRFLKKHCRPFSEVVAGAGCTVGDADRVRVPADLVEKTISQIPGPFSIYGRDVEHEVQIGNQELHGQGISGLPSIRDMETGLKLHRRERSDDGGEAVETSIDG